MREILFRGKNEKTGEWIYGDLLQMNRYTVHIYPKEDCSGDSVAQDTIGQYTGLDDKNGVKIFEGDIVFIGDWECYAEVYFAHGGWYLKFADNDEDLYENYSDCKVSGNIHDNPELLNKETK
jgi:uncharacterized phage protein (TIGR01671 family)